jgi:hypothetical protein
MVRVGSYLPAAQRPIADSRVQVASVAGWSGEFWKQNRRAAGNLGCGTGKIDQEG